ncbi:hypothetical protein EXIGLDRAFT_831261 [Exidia glandulosa HHB12029]|uniref:Uncharacterized protein n=1 Tax=Exidia glandulosa HHB12029 TaxID=1314781 RepID=A0A165MT20_EXIGL|nr:hypothetical protein EXIGLDRAFT_831261 [Exidia glandulosa HHB12029]
MADRVDVKNDFKAPLVARHFMALPPEVKLCICREATRRALRWLALAHRSWTAVAQEALLTNITLTFSDYRLDNTGNRTVEGRHISPAHDAAVRFLAILGDCPAKALHVRSFRVNFKYANDATYVHRDHWTLYMGALKQLRNLRYRYFPFATPFRRLNEVADVIADGTLRLNTISVPTPLFNHSIMDPRHPFSRRLQDALVSQKGSLKAIAVDDSGGGYGVDPKKIYQFFLPTAEYCSTFLHDEDMVTFRPILYGLEHWDLYLDGIYSALRWVFSDPSMAVGRVFIVIGTGDFGNRRVGTFTSLIANRSPRVYWLRFILVKDDTPRPECELLGVDTLSDAVRPFSQSLKFLEFKFQGDLGDLTDTSSSALRQRAIEFATTGLCPELSGVRFPGGGARRRCESEHSVQEREGWQYE